MSEEIGSGFSVWGVLKKSVEVIKNDLSYYLLLILVFGGVYSTLFYILFANYFTNVEFTDNNFPFTATFIAVYILGIVTYVFYNVIIIDRTNAALNDYAFENYPYVSRCLLLLFPLIGLYFVYGIFMWIGFILLIIPGLIIFTIYYLAIPAKVIENIGIFSAMSRSRELTKGHRWSVFAIFLIPYILFLIIYAALISSMITNIQEMGGTGGSFFNEFQILVFFLNTTYFSFNIIASVVAYHELVKEKEGA